MSAVDGMIANALEESRRHGHLHRDGQIDVARAVRFEDRLNELLVQVIEEEIHVVDCLGDRQIEIGIRLEGMGEQTLGLLPHASDQSTEFRVEFLSKIGRAHV